MKNTIWLLGIFVLWSFAVHSSEVRMVKNHIYNWTGTNLRVRCTKTMANKQLMFERFELRSSGSNTINIFPNTCGYIEITNSFFSDEKQPKQDALTDSQRKNANVFQQFRIIYSWLNSSNTINLKMQKAYEDDILEKISVDCLPLSETQDSEQIAGCPKQVVCFFATLLSAEGARESSFYLRSEKEDEA